MYHLQTILSYERFCYWNIVPRKPQCKCNRSRLVRISGKLQLCQGLIVIIVICLRFWSLSVFCVLNLSQNKSTAYKEFSWTTSFKQGLGLGLNRSCLECCSLHPDSTFTTSDQAELSCTVNLTHLWHFESAYWSLQCLCFLLSL